MEAIVGMEHGLEIWPNEDLSEKSIKYCIEAARSTIDASPNTLRILVTKGVTNPKPKRGGLQLAGLQ